MNFLELFAVFALFYDVFRAIGVGALLYRFPGVFAREHIVSCNYYHCGTAGDV